MFFILFINDLLMANKNSETDMYADDSSISNEGNTLPDLNKNLTEHMANVSLWCRQNGMAANTIKTKAMLITTGKRETHLKKTKFRW